MKKILIFVFLFMLLASQMASAWVAAGKYEVIIISNMTGSDCKLNTYKANNGAIQVDTENGYGNPTSIPANSDISFKMTEDWIYGIEAFLHYTCSKDKGVMFLVGQPFVLFNGQTPFVTIQEETGVTVKMGAVYSSQLFKSPGIIHLNLMLSNPPFYSISAISPS